MKTSQTTNISQQPEIAIALIGCVSAGKSTLLNALLSNKYSDMKIKRTTMLPQVYHETSSQKTLKTIKEINIENYKINEKLIKKSETGCNLSIADCKQIDYHIPKIKDLKFLHNCVNLAIYDIPGLNDARTCETYMEWLKNNFHKLDIVIFVIDIMSSLNTSDEMKILKLIVSCVDDMFNKYDKVVRMITAVNKCDNMSIDSKGNIELSEEHAELFDQIKNTIAQATKNIPVMSGEPIIIPMCCKDAFLYRMIKNDKKYIKELTNEQINEVGVNLFGKTFLKKTKDKCREIVESLIADSKNNFIDDTILISGFRKLDETLKSILTKNVQRDIILNNISVDLHNVPELDDTNIEQIITKYDILHIKTRDTIKIFDEKFGTVTSHGFVGKIINNVITYTKKLLQRCDDRNTIEQNLHICRCVQTLFNAINKTDINKYNSDVNLSDILTNIYVVCGNNIIDFNENSYILTGEIMNIFKLACISSEKIIRMLTIEKTHFPTDVKTIKALANFIKLNTTNDIVLLIMTNIMVNVYKKMSVTNDIDKLWFALAELEILASESQNIYTTRLTIWLRTLIADKKINITNILSNYDAEIEKIYVDTIIDDRENKIDEDNESMSYEDDEDSEDKKVGNGGIPLKTMR